MICQNVRARQGNFPVMISVNQDMSSSVKVSGAFMGYPKSNKSLKVSTHGAAFRIMSS